MDYQYFHPPTDQRYIAGNSSPVITEDYTVTPTVTLTLEAIDASGNTRTMWHEVFLDGNPFGSGFTPASYELISGTEYSVAVGEFQQYTFDQWEDGSTDNPRIFTITSDTTFTAFYND